MPRRLPHATLFGVVLSLGLALPGCSGASTPERPAAQPQTATSPSAGREARAARPTRACDVVASPAGDDRAAGTPEAPLRSAQRAFGSLRPGQTACLRAGIYRMRQLRGTASGEPGRPVTLRSFPGERARVVVTEVYLPPGTHDVTFRSMDITNDAVVGRQADVMIQDLSDRSAYVGVTIDASRVASCMILGPPGGQPSRETLIRDSVLRHCGDPADGNQQHAVYLQSTRGTRIERNVIRDTAAYAVHMYPDADGTRVTDNVIDGSGWGGVIFAGSQSGGNRVSDDNLVERNVITGGDRYGIDVFWGPNAPGRGNVARDNCIADNRGGAFRPTGTIAASGNIAAPVRYADPAGGDMRLRADSGCLRAVGITGAVRAVRAGSRGVVRGSISPAVAGARITVERRTRSGAWRRIARGRTVGRAGNALAFRGASRRAGAGDVVRVRVRARGLRGGSAVVGAATVSGS